MASLRKRLRSPYWFACFYNADGTRAQRSTKQSDKRKALGIANQWERAAKLAGQKRLGEAQARRVLSDIYEITNDEPLPSATARDFLTRWAERRKLDTANRTFQAYKQVVRDFLKSLGPRAERDISQISKTDIVTYRDEVLTRTSIATANKSLKYLRVALGAAYKDGLTQDNAASKVDAIRRRDDERKQRRPFTLGELKAILANASAEWRGLILFGFYTGQRLSDIANLTWQNLDLEREVIRFVTGKTGRQMEIPIAAPLLAHIETMPASDDPSAPLFPESSSVAAGESADSRLSQHFYDLLVAAGLAKARRRDKQRDEGAPAHGRSRRRTVHEISFHSLRHTATSLLKNAGVSEAVAMDIIGHDSEAISRHYTHIETKAKRKALAKLPKLF
ncbi:tyrosine-type recombinase/integrase [Opitutus terrae]|uniref:Integrase family protein n=1 Tax=Opitutus terrae (strain DSM 11246 / JCM 15787 / PB90-1) TaxID=452637 RepID=B1ZY20_OPITP|nr:site-specific integrase [Opitutus terrae]ACB75219.1 integrase family protein [Opitutus terrae PB90-1]